MAGSTATAAAAMPRPSPAPSRAPCSLNTRRCSSRRRKPTASQQAQFAAAFEDVAQDDHAEARAAEQQPQPAQDLERAQVSVLHRVELVQPLRRGRQLQAGILQGARQRGGDLRDGVRRGINQKHPVAALARESPGELGLVNEQAALQDRVRHRADQPQLERAALLVRVINRVAELLAQRPFDGVGVADGGNLRDCDLRFAICDCRQSSLRRLLPCEAVPSLGGGRGPWPRWRR